MQHSFLSIVFSKDFLQHNRLSPPTATLPPSGDMILSRAERAHARLAWAARFARIARPETAGQVTIKLFGIPAGFASWLELATV